MKRFARAARAFVFLSAVLLAGCGAHKQSASTSIPPAPPANPLQSAYLRINPPLNKDETRFAVFGDVREGRKVMEKIVADIEKDGHYDFAACSGDMVSMASDSEYDVFKQAVLLNLKKTPLIFTPGNHDVQGEGDARGALYQKYFGAMRYKFAIGKTLFVSIDNATEEVFTEQYNWLESVLKAERAKYDTLIVFMHMPPYDMRGGDQWHAMPPKQGEKLLSLLKQYRTTAVFCGHIHAYYAWDKDGVPIYVTGGAGAELVKGGQHHYLEVAVKDGKLNVTVHPMQ
jgi:Icc-related predicted phosphoesterase